MAFKMKKTVDVEAQTVGFAAIGADDTVLHSVLFDLSKVKPEIVLRLALHGASQKIGDSYAGAGGDDVADPLAFTKEAIAATIKQLYDGDWRTAAVGGPRISDLAVAISQLTGQSVEAVSETLAEATAEQQKAMQKEPRIAAKLAEIRAKRAAEKAAAMAKKADGAEGGLDLTAFIKPAA